jgi:SAM-dependent methyltransferase
VAALTERPGWREDPLASLRRWKARSKRTIWQHAVKGRMGANHVRNFLTDRRYGGFAGGTQGTDYLDEGMLGFSSVDYVQLVRIFDAENDLAIGPDDVLVDIGCGKGRVLNWWLGRGQGNRIYGLEIDEGLAAQARDRLAGFPNVTILTGDALSQLPPDATILFMFNPFWDEVVERFKDRVVEVYGERSTLRIAYFMPMFESQFTSDPRFVVKRGQTKTIYSLSVITLADAQERARR